MATSLLVLLDDIASVLDDVSTLTAVAAKKTAGVLGDDLALNAKQIAGVRAARELPVVWAVARGSALNKLLLVPAALAVSHLAPWAVTPLLMAGGAYLCYEGCEKLLHRLLHPREYASAESGPDPAGSEDRRIAGAIRTDFILSAEIIVIALGVVAGRPFATQAAVLAAVATAMTVGVYGLVAGIVKLDDLGAWLVKRRGSLARRAGRGILMAAPWLMRGLSVAGAAAMFLVGGGIIAHGIPAVHHTIHGLVAAAGRDPRATWWSPLVGLAADATVGVATGAIVLAVVIAAGGLRQVGRIDRHA